MKKIVLLLLVITAVSCTEPYALQTNTFENAIVIEATITNELKKQEIKISRTFQLEEKEPQPETNATVYITDDLGNQYNFNETDGKYISQFEFQAMSERQYQLFVNTSNGKQYTSTREKLTTINNLTSVEATVKNKFGVNGVDITANSFDPTGTSKYYRYEYEETYKTIAPFWAPDSLQIFGNAEEWNLALGHIEYAFTQHQRVGESKTCYKTEVSNDIILENTTLTGEDKIKDYSIRFISQDNYNIANRYSIKVRQYIQSLASYTYYKTLKDISASGNVLSPSQPGFINGNISSVENKNEKVIGFFDISSVSEKRIFFNYNDLFPGEPEPPYFYDCEISTYDRTKKKTVGETPFDGLTYLVINTRSGKLILYEREDPIFKMVPPQCGDCRTVGSNVIPDFWQ
ncbi:DUF4249 domain-containing protein [uncultured Flavobacterium sp.]|uniref:DUF4249 domain-containing protein n=1 Tax=uncultured Flavobacterium sp. TaxID=165435 RepID=UPI0030ED6C2A|tara:strand:+ start:92231 stop:93439 length:1209 start_codon:yes stop_codon:yes gene_type:complete